ncbi:MAG: hypothetical protein Q4D71_08960 [Oscillospiraceae bacterium]|nr:hypothetical protein [Oscillospiraceae bacterium]
MDEMMYHSFENNVFMKAIDVCAKKSYSKKKEIESWFCEGGKYDGNYAVADIFHALFNGNIETIVERREDYYYENENRRPSEIFADLSSIMLAGKLNEPLLKELIDAFVELVR